MTILFANNAKSTLAGAINNAVTSLTLSAGTGALFPNPTAPDYFVMTLSDAATNLNREIVWVTARVGDVCTILRAQEGTAAQSWLSGDLANNRWTAGQASAMGQTANGRTKLLTSTSFYVSPSGSDSTGDGSNGNPWATAQKAVNVLAASYDFGGQAVTIVRKDSLLYTDAVAVTGLFVGQTGPLVFSASASGNVTVTSAGSQCYLADAGASISVLNQKLVCPGGNSLYATRSSILTYGGVNFGAAGGSHISADRSSEVASVNNYTISGAASSHWGLSQGANADFSVVATLVGTPAITQFAQIAQCSVLNATAGSFSGSGTGIRYVVTLNGVINTSGGGANFFPGNSPGSTATGGQYA